MLTQARCPSCGTAIDFLPGTVAVRCQSCGSIAHTATPASGSQAATTRAPEVHVHLASPASFHHALALTNPTDGRASIEEARFRYERLKDKVEDLKRKRQEARETYGRHYKGEIKFAQLLTIGLFGLFVAWILGQNVAAILQAVAVVWLTVFLYLVGFGKRKIRRVSREIEAAEAEVRRVQDGK